MTEPTTHMAAQIIASLSDHHDRLAELVTALDDETLAGPSGASEWSIAQVLSHLGSGAEITSRPVEAAIAGDPVGEADNQAVWDRWDAASPREQASWFVQHDAHLVDTLLALDEEQRGTVLVDLGFLPEPVPLVVALGMRLNEVANHAWDVLAGLEDDATVDEQAAELLVELYAGPLGFLLGFTGKADALAEPAVVAAFGHGLVIEDAVSIVAEPPVAPTATFVGEQESFVRLLSGRLGPGRTPEGVAVHGNITLDDLRGVFPGF